MENTVMSAEAEHWMEVAHKLLESRDLIGSRKFAKRARESNRQIDGVDQIIAVLDVLLAAEKRINNHLDWYAILQIDGRSKDIEFIKRQYKQLVLLLHPDKNKFPCSDNAFKLVCDAWGFLSDPNKKSLYDNEFNLYLKFDPVVLQNRRSVREKKKTAKAMEAEEEEVETVQGSRPPPARLSTFWTVCPYCYHLYEYPRVYEDCCLRCQKCRRGFHAVVIPSPPPAVGLGKDLYYCCWAIFPIGFTTPENLGKDSSWRPFDSMFSERVEVEARKRSYLNKDDDLGDVRGGKKGKTDYVDDNVWMNATYHAERAKQGNGNKIQGEDTGKKVVEDGNAAKNVEPPKTLRTKTTARKSIKPKPNTQKRAEPQDMIDGGKSGSSLMGMDLNIDIKNDVEEPKKKGVVEGTLFGSLDTEATEGIGFFEGLDDILGNLPMLQVPVEQKSPIDC